MCQAGGSGIRFLLLQDFCLPQAVGNPIATAYPKKSIILLSPISGRGRWTCVIRQRHSTRCTALAESGGEAQQEASRCAQGHHIAVPWCGFGGQDATGVHTPLLWHEAASSSWKAKQSPGHSHPPHLPPRAPSPWPPSPGCPRPHRGVPAALCVPSTSHKSFNLAFPPCRMGIKPASSLSGGMNYRF